MKIAYVMDQLLACGGCLVPFEHCRELKKRGYDARIVANGTNEIIQESFPDVEVMKPLWLEGFTDEDVIVAVWWPQTEWLIEKKGRKIQFVQGRDDLADVGDDVKEKNLVVRLDSRWELMGVSRYALSWIGCGREGTVIPNGLSYKFYKKHNIERDIDILIVGNNEPHKRIDEAIAIAKQAGGKIAWFGLTTKTVEGIETFTNPPQSQIPKIYQRSKVVLMLSKSEGFWLPPLEAMASGCIVVCNDAGGNDFCEDGKNCFKTEPEKMVQIIKGILNPPDVSFSIWFAKIITNAQETAERFTWGKAGGLLEKYYDRKTTKTN